MHAEAYAFLQAHAPAAAKSVLDVGGRDINGSPRGLFPAAAYTALDVVDGPGVDVLADIVSWDEKGKFDVVICAEVLEHAANWDEIVGACWDRLKVGGTLLLTCATSGRVPHSAVDGGPLRKGEPYGNVPAEALTDVLVRLGVKKPLVEEHRDRGDLYAAAVKRRGASNGPKVGQK